MNAVAHLSSDADAVDFPYRAISRASIVSVALGVVALIGLIPAFQAMLVLALFGIAAAVMGLRATRAFPNEYSGQSLAIAGLAFNALVFMGGLGEHAYIYATEVPEGFQRVHFKELQQPAGAPDLPTSRAMELDGEDIFVKGYIHPASGNGQLQRFVLIPDLGTCCFGGQPRSSDMVEVTLVGGETVSYAMTQKKLAGKFIVDPRGGSGGGFDMDNPVYYRLRAEYVK